MPPNHEVAIPGGYPPVVAGMHLAYADNGGRPQRYPGAKKNPALFRRRGFRVKPLAMTYSCMA